MEGWVLGNNQTNENHDGPKNVEGRYLYSLKIEKYDYCGFTLFFMPLRCSPKRNNSFIKLI